MKESTIHNVILLGVAAVSGYLFMKAMSGDTMRNGFTVQGTDGKTYNLQQRKDGYIYDQYGGMWT